MPELESVQVILQTTMGTDAWDVSLPIDVAAQALIAKFVRTQQFGFRERDDAGNLIPYRLLWKEGERYLGEAETLRGADVKEGHTLVMAHEARAGFARSAARSS
jgi:hypothetical protein